MTVIVATLLVVLILCQAWERDRHRRQLQQFVIDAANERRHLEEKIIALSQPMALSTVKSYDDPEPGQVRYVDEEPGTDTTQRRGHVPAAQA